MITSGGSSPAAGPRKVDPRLNPITRRPGPGRPKKKLESALGPANAPTNAGQSPFESHTPPPTAHEFAPVLETAMGQPLHTPMSHIAPQLQSAMEPFMESTINPQHPHHHELQHQHQLQHQHRMQHIQRATHQLLHSHSTDDEDDHRSKRPKVEESEPLDDEAVLVLASADSHAGAVGHYPQECVASLPRSDPAC